MIALFLTLIASSFKSKSRLVAERGAPASADRFAA
jgi:hypothetical protein